MNLLHFFVVVSDFHSSAIIIGACIGILAIVIIAIITTLILVIIVLMRLKRDLQREINSLKNGSNSQMVIYEDSQRVPESSLPSPIDMQQNKAYSTVSAVNQ